jgi:Immunoglobulin I-set domain
MKVSSSGSATALISDHRRIVSSAASSSGWLLLRQSTGQDSGRYRCQATNVHGQVEADVQLNVHGPYQVNVEPKQQVHFLINFKLISSTAREFMDLFNLF